MAYLLDITIDAKALDLDELWDLEKEVAVASRRRRSGLVEALYNVVAQRRVIGIIDAPDHDTVVWLLGFAGERAVCRCRNAIDRGVWSPVSRGCVRLR